MTPTRRPIRPLTPFRRSLGTAAIASFCASLLVCSSACSTLGGTEPPLSKKASLGELVFRILHDNLAQSAQCAPQYVAALDARHTDFVTTFDYTLTHDVQGGIPDVLGGTIVPLVQNGQLPALVDQLAEAMALLISDSFDANRDTLASLVKIANGRTMLENTMVFSLVDAILADSAIRDRLHSLALLSQENDGVDYTLDEVLALVSSYLATDHTSTCSGLTVPDVQSTVFRTTGYVEDAALALGTPAYAARPDANYNARVLVDSATGALATPFVDVNPADGVADVNVAGEPIDATGAVIDIPILGTGANRDAYGRALNAHGGMLYDYFDVKRTTLSYAAQVGADFIEGDYHHDIPAIANAVLGAPSTCSYGTPLGTCREYGAPNHPLADLYFLVTDILRFPKLVSLLDALQVLLAADPNKAETLLMTLGDVVTALDASTLTLTDTTLVDTAQQLLPLLNTLFQVSNTSGQTTPRLLADIIHAMPAATRAQIPPQIGYMLEFRTLTNHPSATVAPQGTRVDYSLTRFPSVNGQTVDNRAMLEQMLDLITYADCGNIAPQAQGGTQLGDYFYTFIDGAFYPGAAAPTPGTLAEVMVDAAGRADTSTLQTLLALASWFTNNSSGGGIAGAIQGLGCPAANANALAYHLPLLESLKNTGVLDWVIPVAQAVGQQGQRRALVDMGLALGNDLKKDGTYLVIAANTPVATTQSTVRRFEPPLDSMVQTGAVNRLLDGLDTMYSIQVGPDDAVDLLFDVAAYFVVNGTVPTRQGNVANTSRGVQLMGILKTLATRLDAASAGDELSHLVHFATGYVQRTDPLGGGARRLHFRNLRLLLAVGSELLHDAAQLDATSFTCYVDSLQTDGVDFLTQRDFATIVRILNQILASPNAMGLEDWIVSLLRGGSGAISTEKYGQILQIAASLAATDPDQISDQDVSNITHWLSGVLGQTTGASAREIIATLDTIVSADTNGAMLQMVRNAIRPGPLASHEEPAMTFADVYAEVDGFDRANMCVAPATNDWTVARIESTLSAVIDFVHDDQNGLGAVWRLVGTLPPAE